MSRLSDMVALASSSSHPLSLVLSLFSLYIYLIHTHTHTHTHTLLFSLFLSFPHTHTLSLSLSFFSSSLLCSFLLPPQSPLLSPLSLCAVYTSAPATPLFSKSREGRGVGEVNCDDDCNDHWLCFLMISPLSPHSASCAPPPVPNLGYCRSHPC